MDTILKTKYNFLSKRHWGHKVTIASTVVVIYTGARSSVSINANSNSGGVGVLYVFVDSIIAFWVKRVGWVRMSTRTRRSDQGCQAIALNVCKGFQETNESVFASVVETDECGRLLQAMRIGRWFYERSELKRSNLMEWKRAMKGQVSVETFP